MATRPPTSSTLPAPTPPARSDQPRLVIVGAGMVAWKLCQALFAGPTPPPWHVTLVGDEPHAPYDRVHLTDYFERGSADSLLLSPRDWYGERGIVLRTGLAATHIDRSRRTVHLSDGTGLLYDRLVLATGSHPFVPPLSGADHPQVCVYRTLADLDRIRALARNYQHAAVIGGGLLGLEAAKALLDLGLSAIVIERGSGLMGRQLTPDASALLRAKVEALGVRVLTPRDTRAVRPLRDGCIELNFTNAEPLRVGFLVIAAGIVPRDELARACDLECHPRGGVVIDDHLVTSDPRIHAVGECASHAGLTYGLAGPGYLMAEILAERLLGDKNVRFRGATLATRLKLLGVDVCSAGDFQSEGESVVHRTADTYRELVFQRGRLVGALSVGPCPETARLQAAVEARKFFWPHRRNQFSDTGLLFDAEESADPALWPADAVVCACKGVTRGRLTAALREGCATADALAACTGASTVCGSCRPLLVTLAGAPATPPRPTLSARLLFGVCTFAMLVALLVVFARPIPHGQSVEQRAPWEFLLLDPWWRRATGFTVLGCAVASLVLSLRKRIRRFTLGSFGGWRVLHTVLGLLGLVTLVAHTGMNLGSNFNRILLIDFLGLVALGVAAGFVTALEARLDPRRALRLRRAYTWAHIVLVWPLPPLVGFHIAAAYYYGAP